MDSSASRVRRNATPAALTLAALVAMGPGARAQDVVAKARAVVAAATAPSSSWDGPTSGPRAVASKTVVYVAADLRNGGIQEVGDGVKEAGKKIGWSIRVLDGQGSVSGIQSAFSQAIALKPDGIIIGGFDVVQTPPPSSRPRTRASGSRPGTAARSRGPMPDYKIISNIGSDSARVAKVAADYAIAQSDGHAGVIIFTDSAYAIALSKAKMMRDEIHTWRGLHGAVLRGHAARRHLDPDVAAHHLAAAALRPQMDLQPGDQRPVFRLHRTAFDLRRPRPRRDRPPTSAPATAATPPTSGSAPARSRPRPCRSRCCCRAGR